MTLSLALALSTICCAQGRKEINLASWDFSQDGKSWHQVTVPHDWAIAGPFDKKWDLQHVAIKENGETHATEHSGRSGALPWIGKGEYKTTFKMPEGYKHTEIYFDGAMAGPQVYVNGKKAGEWKYGYNAFRLDITPYIVKGENTIDVKLENLEETNRWYPGAGIYRPVKLVFTGDASINPWGTFFRTISADSNKAVLELDLAVAGKGKKLTVRANLLDANRQNVASRGVTIGAKGQGSTQFELANPQLWSPESPNLYTLQLFLYQGTKLIDKTEQKVGIRTLAFSKEHGFQLNGVSRKFRGVCLHHDLGPLGAAVNKAALIRQIRIMKEMGADAIRTSHNMPSQMQMEVCDSMGMMVMAESFDGWKELKVKNGYGRFYDEWWRKDLANLILGHRNHPSIVMWSIGNEIPEQWKKEGAERAKMMRDFCHTLDDTRMVTCGADQVDGDVKSGFYAAVDVPGFNYRVHKYRPNIGNMRQGFILGSETASTVSSRGVYKFPVEVGYGKTYEDGQCGSYDVEHCSWSNLPDDDWELQDDEKWTLGEFVWTGFDYLGEPSPYDAYWPSRSSYFGIVDLAGIPKDRYYLYRSHWNKEKHTIHLLPHWNWEGREGQVTPVYCYTDYPSAELFVNGKSQGRIAKDKSSRLDRYRLRWNDVRYEPGELKVVVYDEMGKKAGEQVVRTASAPMSLRLEADREVIKADGNDLSFITVSMVDKDGNACPTVNDELTFEVSGAGSYKAACNGDATSLEPFTQPLMKLFNGKLVVIVQSGTSKGNILLKVKDAQRGIEKTIDISAI